MTTRLVPAGLAGLLTAIAVLSLVVVSGLGVWFAGQHTGTSVDQSVYWAVYKQFVGDRGLLRAMLLPTEPVLLVVVIGLIVMVAVARRRPRLAILAVAGPLVTVTITSSLLKPLFGRTINNGSLAFPSGHTSGLVAVLAVLIVGVAGSTRPPRRKSLTTAVVIFAAVLTVIGATALVGMKYHYVTDTLGGACMGVATVFLVAPAIDWLAGRRAERKRTATSGGGAVNAPAHRA